MKRGKTAVIVGAQWGDEGKGKIVDVLSNNFSIVARYAGRPVGEVFHGTFPHFIAHLFAIAIFVAFPDIILWLPNHMQH